MENKNKGLFEMILDENEGEGMFALSLVDNPAMKSYWVALEDEDKKIVQFATVDKDKRILLGAVLIPELPVYRNWEGGMYVYFSEETIRQTQELAMRKGLTTFTLMHSKPVPNIHLLENWLVEDPEKDKSSIYGLNFPKGTWVVSLKINNDEVWEDYIKTGELAGFSIEGLYSLAKTDMELNDDDFLDALRKALLP